MSQKTYGATFSCFPARYGEVRLSQKNGCGACNISAAASLFLGGVISGIALYLKNPLILLVIAFIPVLETISVILQVASFKLTGKRIFRMAPIHHHFELCGWSETRIVAVFSVITAIMCLVGLIALK